MRIQLPSGTSAELARCEGREPVRGIVLLPDIMGLRPLFDEIVRRLAEENGWVVVAPEPFPGPSPLPLEDRVTAMPGYDHARHVADAVDAAGVLGVEPVGITGFCMGGMGALRAAATGRFDRAASFYGMIRVPEAWRSGAPDPIDELLANTGTAERVLAIIGTADPYTPPEDVDDLEKAGATVLRYEGAEHGFVHDPARPAHRPADAADAWRRVTAWFSAGAFSTQ